MFLFQGVCEKLVVQLTDRLWSIIENISIDTLGRGTFHIASIHLYLTRDGSRISERGVKRSTFTCIHMLYQRVLKDIFLVILTNTVFTISKKVL